MSPTSLFLALPALLAFPPVESKDPATATSVPVDAPAIQFDRLTSLLSIDGSGGELDATTAYTIYCRMKILSPRPWNTQYWSKDGENEYAFFQDSSQRFRAASGDNRAQFNTGVALLETLRDGNWHWLGVSFSAAGTVVVVDDTEQSESSDATGAAITDTLADVQFAGGTDTGGATTTNWRLDEWHFYSASTTAANMVTKIASGDFSDSVDSLTDPSAGATREGLALSKTDVTTWAGNATFDGAELLILSGQSLANGDSSGSASTPVPSGHYRRWRANKDKDGVQLLTSGVSIEPPLDGYVIGFQSDWQQPVLGCESALSGTRMDEIDKPSGTYTGVLNCLSLGAAPPYRFVALVNGETDETEGTTEAAYRDNLAGWVQDLNTDIRAVTGQAEPVWVIVSQISRATDTTIAVANAQYRMAKTDPRVFLAGPKYHLRYADAAHVDGPSSRAMGMQLGEVARNLAMGRGWEPLWPQTVQTEGDDVVIVLNKPAVRDLATVAPRPLDGFTGSGFTVESVTFDGRTIRVDTDENPPTGEIQYAATATSAASGVPRGPFRTDKTAYAYVELAYDADTTYTVTINGVTYSQPARTDADTTASFLAQKINAGQPTLFAERTLDTGGLSVIARDRVTEFTFSAGPAGAVDTIVNFDWLVHFRQSLQ